MADSGSTTVISADTSIKGEVAFSSAAEIQGTVDGKIQSKDQVKIANGANCSAEIDAQRIVVEGKVNGKLIARDRVELLGTASLEGDIVATNLVVQDGASLVGHCKIGPDAAKGSSKPQVETKPAGAKAVAKV